ncbi:integrase catalytic domain-containing protein [Trichonephila clavipes]|nr:integrase catalytic domain-containing protein [Trichonephila clavipes]
MIKKVKKVKKVKFKALTTCIESKQILEDASMDLRKWRTYSSELNQRLKNLNFEVDEHKGSLNTLIASKVLGVGWNEKSDTFYFDSSDLGTFLSKRINTKRYLLQAAGRLFDPGGRLKHSTLSEFQKHQMMLPKAHHLTDLIIEHYHKKSLHSGLQTTLYLIRQFYWIPSGQNRVRRILNKCITCFRTKTQMMGDLTRDRIVPSRPFEKVGLHYAGPIITKPNLKRSRVTLKSYIAIFICFSTKATHLEVVSDLTTEAFLACLRRFIARRSKPSVIWSDNATNFKGARNILNEWNEICKSNRISYSARKRESNGTSFHPLLPISVDCGKQTLSP